MSVSSELRNRRSSRSCRRAESLKHVGKALQDRIDCRVVAALGTVSVIVAVIVIVMVMEVMIVRMIGAGRAEMFLYICLFGVRIVVATLFIASECERAGAGRCMI